MNSAALSKLGNAELIFEGAADSVGGVFDDGYASVPLGAGIASGRPTFTLATDKVPPGVIDSQATVRGVQYRVAGHEPDGAGMSVLVLEKP